MIRKAKLTDSSIIASIHMRELKGDFLASLGIGFLTEFYSLLIMNSKNHISVYEEDDEIRGFVIGTDNTKSLFSNVVSIKCKKLIYYLFLSILFHPGLIKNVLQTMFYIGKSFPVNAELVVIAVKRKYQNKGIGKKLINDLEKYFMNKKIFEYKLTVKKDKVAVKIYDHLGFRKRLEFSQYNKQWYLFTKELW